jgi:hypothetical protein
MPAFMAASSSSVGKIVPGLSAGIMFNLPAVGFSKANNPALITSIGKNYTVEP